ncbi:MAPEG family protein [Methylobacterium symbioticum]|uniref:Inner membrane protein YecN n=1 Tax=Methylobacterium symbioticum TaxID=2584084 RepID=A0A509EFE4_9HYPH|nr:MAPEG family protein [Methylobacterium symbioticum]VUD72772.1 Inner membrane protein YecN [Methylobacterium symbioticum]
MTYPTTTAFFAGLFALLYVGLAGWVVAGRLSGQTLFGNGDEALTRRVRAHANFGEYVPLALLLVGLLEAGGASHGFVTGLLVVLFVARLLHPVGMLAPKNSAQQFACRGGGIVATFGVLAVAAIALLLRA